MTVKPNDAKFIKIPPKKQVGHMQKGVKQDNYALFRQSVSDDLEILLSLKLYTSGSLVQADVITRDTEGECHGKSYLITVNTPNAIQDVINMLLKPTISAQLKGYSFTYNMLDMVKNIGTRYNIRVKVDTTLMDKAYIQSHNGKPKGYILGNFGIIGYNYADMSGTMVELVSGVHVVCRLQLRTLQLEESRRAAVKVRMQNQLESRGKVLNISMLERELMIPIQVKVLDSPEAVEVVED